MIKFKHPDLIGSEPKKKIKFRVVKNSWILIEDYRPHMKHQLLVEIKNDWVRAWVQKMTFPTISYRFIDTDMGTVISGVKRVMILSRK
jgi:hypothetical protein